MIFCTFVQKMLFQTLSGSILGSAIALLDYHSALASRQRTGQEAVLVLSVLKIINFLSFIDPCDPPPSEGICQHLSWNYFFYLLLTNIDISFLVFTSRLQFQQQQQHNVIWGNMRNGNGHKYIFEFFIACTVYLRQVHTLSLLQERLKL